MSKKDFIREIAEETGLTYNEAAKAVNAVIRQVAEELQNGRNITLNGLGTFSRQMRSARNGRNPRTGEVIEIPAHHTVKFKASKGLKDSFGEKAA